MTGFPRRYASNSRVCVHACASPGHRCDEYGFDGVQPVLGLIEHDARGGVEDAGGNLHAIAQSELLGDGTPNLGAGVVKRR